MHKILIYLHIIHLLKSSACFEHYSAHLQEVFVVIVYMQPLVSSLSAGDCPVHQLIKNSPSFLTGVQESHLQRVTIPEATYIHLRRRYLEDEVYVVIVYMQPLVSSLSAGDCPVHRLRENSSSFLTGVQGSHLQRVTTPAVAYIQLRRRPPDDEQVNARNM